MCRFNWDKTFHKIQKAKHKSLSFHHLLQRAVAAVTSVQPFAFSLMFPNLLFYSLSGQRVLSRIIVLEVWYALAWASWWPCFHNATRWLSVNPPFSFFSSRRSCAIKTCNRFWLFVFFFLLSTCLRSLRLFTEPHRSLGIFVSVTLTSSFKICAWKQTRRLQNVGSDLGLVVLYVTTNLTRHTTDVFADCTENIVPYWCTFYLYTKPRQLLSNVFGLKFPVSLQALHLKASRR